MAGQINITPLAELTDDMHRPTIMGRITKIWTAHNPETKRIYSYDFVMVDNENKAIEGFIYVDDPYAENLLQKLHEGSIHKFFKFRMDSKRKKLATVDHKLRIQLTGATKVTKIEKDDPAFPQYYFDFKPLKSIGVTIAEEKSVVDIIGQVVSIGPVKKILQSNRSISIRDLEIEDERNDKILVTIWEDHLPEINIQKIQEDSKTQHIILAFSSLLLTFFSGTRIYQDRSLPPIAEFQNRISRKKLQFVLQQSTGPEGSELVSAPISIRELRNKHSPEFENQVFNVVAEIIEVLDEYGWYYDACPVHKTRIRTAEGYTCHICRAPVKKTIPWYSFCSEVTDGIANTKFVFIGKLPERLLGSTAQDLLAQPKTNEDEFLPTKFNDLIHKKFLFTVQSGNNKFRSNMITYQVKDANPIPPTAAETTSPHPPATPAESYGKNSSESSTTMTTNVKSARRQLFTEHQSKKTKNSSESSKEKEKEA